MTLAVPPAVQVPSRRGGDSSYTSLLLLVSHSFFLWPCDFHIPALGDIVNASILLPVSQQSASGWHLYSTT